MEEEIDEGAFDAYSINLATANLPFGSVNKKVLVTTDASGRITFNSLFLPVPHQFLKKFRIDHPEGKDVRRLQFGTDDHVLAENDTPRTFIEVQTYALDEYYMFFCSPRLRMDPPLPPNTQIEIMGEYSDAVGEQAFLAATKIFFFPVHIPIARQLSLSFNLGVFSVVTQAEVSAYRNHVNQKIKIARVSDHLQICDISRQVFDEDFFDYMPGKKPTWTWDGYSVYTDPPYVKLPILIQDKPMLEAYLQADPHVCGYLKLLKIVELAQLFI